MATIRSEVKRVIPEMVSIRRHFHQHPELGLDLFKTADFVERKLKSFGITTARMARTGVVATIGGKKGGKTILIRADMDALPVMEGNKTPYISRIPGVMHA